MTGKCWCDCEQKMMDPTMCGGCPDAEDANEKYHQDDLRAFEDRTYPSPGDVPDKEG